MKNVFISDVSSIAPAFPDAMLEGYPKEGSNPTEPGAWWYHMVTMELVNAISAGGVVPDASQVNQLANIITNLVQGQATLVAAQAAVLAVGTPYGAFLPWPGETPPPGYIKANGALLARTGGGAYPKLTAAFLGGGLKVVTEAVWTAGAKGSYSQGDGSTNYRIPELRGEFLRGWDDGRGVDASRVVGSPQADSSAYHQHYTVAFDGGRVGLNGTNYLRNFVAVAEGGLPNNNANFEYVLQGTAALPTAGLTSSSGQSNETRPRNVSVLWCIRAYDPN